MTIAAREVSREEVVVVGKLLVLLGGLCGVAAFFLPLMLFPHGDSKVGVSTYQFVRGVEGVREALGVKEDDTPEARKQAEDADKTFSEAKPVFLALFAPTALLALVGLAGFAGRMGRGKGLLALLFGALGFGAWFFVRTVVEEMQKTQAVEEGLAVMLLLASAAAGCLGALLAIANPERPPAA